MSTYISYRSWSEDIKNLYREQRARCPYCGLDGASDYRLRRLFVVDHIVPRARRDLWESQRENLFNKVLCCDGCNYNKGKWDASAGGPAPTTSDDKKRLIGIVRDHLKRHDARDRQDHEEMLADF